MQTVFGRLHTYSIAALFCASMLSCITYPTSAEPVRFYSNQLTPLEESDILQTVVLRDSPVSVEFHPVDGRAVTYKEAAALAAAGKYPVVIGGLYPDFRVLKKTDLLAPVDDIWRGLAGRSFTRGLERAARLQSDHEYFVPWMQATYLMAANRRALRYLPSGASLDSLTYEQLEQWAKNMYRATGQARLGFPAGPNGLFSRFLEGYLVPSFVGRLSGSFSGSRAVGMWSFLRSLWRYVAPSSFELTRMDQALLNGEVWVAWDHSARLLEAFRQRPEEFVAFPAPIGPVGRGYLQILAGLGVPRGPIDVSSQLLITYLTSPKAQALTFSRLGFLPVISVSTLSNEAPDLNQFLRAASEQIGSSIGIPGEQPDFTAADSNRFNLIYLGAFSAIVLSGEQITQVSSVEGPKLDELLARQRDAAAAGE